jgi:hypothetical protein
VDGPGGPSTRIETHLTHELRVRHEISLEKVKLISRRLRPWVRCAADRTVIGRDIDVLRIRRKTCTSKLHILIIICVHAIPYCSHPSLIVPPHVRVVLRIVVGSRLRDRQLGLILCPLVILRPIDILPLTASRCVLVLTVSQYLLVIDRRRRRNLLEKTELPHDSIWIVILNHSEMNHPHTTLPTA